MAKNNVWNYNTRLPKKKKASEIPDDFETTFEMTAHKASSALLPARKPGLNVLLPTVTSIKKEHGIECPSGESVDFMKEPNQFISEAQKKSCADEQIDYDSDTSTIPEPMDEDEGTVLFSSDSDNENSTEANVNAKEMAHTSCSQVRIKSEPIKNSTASSVNMDNVNYSQIPSYKNIENVHSFLNDTSQCDISDSVNVLSTFNKRRCENNIETFNPNIRIKQEPRDDYENPSTMKVFSSDNEKSVANNIPGKIISGTMQNSVSYDQTNVCNENFNPNIRIKIEPPDNCINLCDSNSSYGSNLNKTQQNRHAKIGASIQVPPQKIKSEPLSPSSSVTSATTCETSKKSEEKSCDNVQKSRAEEAALAKHKRRIKSEPLSSSSSIGPAREKNSDFREETFADSQKKRSEMETAIQIPEKKIKSEPLSPSSSVTSATTCKTSNKSEEKSPDNVQKCRAKILAAFEKFKKRIKSEPLSSSSSIVPAREKKSSDFREETCADSQKKLSEMETAIQISEKKIKSEPLSPSSSVTSATTCETSNKSEEKSTDNVQKCRAEIAGLEKLDKRNKSEPLSSSSSIGPARERKSSDFREETCADSQKKNSKMETTIQILKKKIKSEVVEEVLLTKESKEIQEKAHDESIHPIHTVESLDLIMQATKDFVAERGESLDDNRKWQFDSLPPVSEGSNLPPESKSEVSSATSPSSRVSRENFSTELLKYFNLNTEINKNYLRETLIYMSKYSLKEHVRLPLNIVIKKNINEQKLSPEFLTKNKNQNIMSNEKTRNFDIVSSNRESRKVSSTDMSVNSRFRPPEILIGRSNYELASILPTSSVEKACVPSHAVSHDLPNAHSSGHFGFKLNTEEPVVRSVAGRMPHVSGAAVNFLPLSTLLPFISSPIAGVNVSEVSTQQSQISPLLSVQSVMSERNTSDTAAHNATNALRDIKYQHQVSGSIPIDSPSSSLPCIPLDPRMFSDVSKIDNSFSADITDTVLQRTPTAEVTCTSTKATVSHSATRSYPNFNVNSSAIPVHISQRPDSSGQCLSTQVSRISTTDKRVPAVSRFLPNESERENKLSSLEFVRSVPPRDPRIRHQPSNKTQMHSNQPKSVLCDTSNGNKQIAPAAVNVQNGMQQQFPFPIISPSCSTSLTDHHVSLNPNVQFYSTRGPNKLSLNDYRERQRKKGPLSPRKGQKAEPFKAL